MEDNVRSTKKKRSNGEGSIYKTNKGGYTGAISYHDETGKRKRKTFTRKTKREVLNAMEEFKNKHHGKQYISSKENITVKEWFHIWFNEYAINSIKQSTRVTYESYIKNHINPRFGSMKLSAVRSDMIQSFYNEKLAGGNLRREGGMKPKTIKNIHNMLHKAFEQAVNNDIIIKNPVKNTSLPKIEKKSIEILTVEQQKKLLKAVVDERLGIGIFLALGTGMRIGEITGLQWKDIDFEKEIINVKYTFNRLKDYGPNPRNKTELVLGSAKTKGSVRSIPISPELMTRIEIYQNMVESEKEFFGAEYSDRGFFICNETGNPIEPRYYQKYFKELLEKLELPEMGFHSLRHTFATRAIEMNIPIKVVSDILGHSSITITMDLYAHVLENTKRNEIEKISAMFLSIGDDV
ncbi:MAG: site-specific integrase [Tissierellaceae bacterium]|nr:site-specific integrase [Tissierellaceae bacterium]